MNGVGDRSSGPRPRGARYERSSPNSLWHIDIKGPFFIQLGRDRRYLKSWIFGLVDDHSRYVLGLRIATTREVAPILVWLRDCIELCGTPLDLMSDNGTEFVHWMPGVLNRFGKTLRELQVRHIKTQIDSPWTNGKIESFWATLESEVLDREVFRSLVDAGGGARALRPLLQLPPTARRDRLAHTGRAIRRHAIHRPWLRERSGAGAPDRLA